MSPETRKRKFVAILQELLADKCSGVQARLANQIQIGSSRISRWLSGQVDPINLETLVFFRLAMLRGCSSEELAKSLGFIPSPFNSQERFRLLIKEMLSNKTQEQLGEILGVSQNAISTWLNPDKTIDPSKIPAGTMFAIAHEQGWTFDDLGKHLGLKLKQNTLKSFLNKHQLELSQLSLKEKEELLVWLSNSITERVDNSNNQENFASTNSSQTASIILEKEDITIATKYATHLCIHLQIDPNDIKIATISKFPQPLKDSDLLIFDIETTPSSAIDRINKISFDGDIVIFASPELEEEVRSQLEDKVTDIVLKPIDWDSLKDKPYFTST